MCIIVIFPFILHEMRDIGFLGERLVGVQAERRPDENSCRHL